MIEPTQTPQIMYLFVLAFLFLLIDPQLYSKSTAIDEGVQATKRLSTLQSHLNGKVFSFLCVPFSLLNLSVQTPG